MHILRHIILHLPNDGFTHRGSPKLSAVQQELQKRYADKNYYVNEDIVEDAQSTLEPGHRDYDRRRYRDEDDDDDSYRRERPAPRYILERIINDLPENDFTRSGAARVEAVRRHLDRHYHREHYYVTADMVEDAQESLEYYFRSRGEFRREPEGERERDREHAYDFAYESERHGHEEGRRGYRQQGERHEEEEHRRRGFEGGRRHGGDWDQGGRHEHEHHEHHEHHEDHEHEREHYHHRRAPEHILANIVRDLPYRDFTDLGTARLSAVRERLHDRYHHEHYFVDEEMIERVQREVRPRRDVREHKESTREHRGTRGERPREASERAVEAAEGGEVRRRDEERELTAEAVEFTEIEIDTEESAPPEEPPEERRGDEELPKDTGRPRGRARKRE